MSHCLVGWLIIWSVDNLRIGEMPVDDSFRRIICFCVLYWNILKKPQILLQKNIYFSSTFNIKILLCQQVMNNFQVAL